MALHELQRYTAQRPRTAVNLLQLIAHVEPPSTKLNCAWTDREHCLVPASVARRSQDWTGHRLGGINPGVLQPPGETLRLCGALHNRTVDGGQGPIGNPPPKAGWLRTCRPC